MGAKTRLYSRRPGILAADLGNELALLDLPSGNYLGFNATGAHTWRLIERPQTLDAICEAMTAEFCVGHDQCRQEVAALLKRLVAVGLVTATDVDDG